jgi:hypothetical protein
MKLILMIAFWTVLQKTKANPSIRFETAVEEGSKNEILLEEFNILVLNDKIGYHEFKTVSCIKRSITKNEGYAFSIQLSPKGTKKLHEVLANKKIKSVLLVFNEVYFKLILPDKIDKWANTVSFSANLSSTKLIALENDLNELIKKNKLLKKAKEDPSQNKLN